MVLLHACALVNIQLREVFELGGNLSALISKTPKSFRNVCAQLGSTC